MSEPNKSYEVEEAYKKAWLLHLHRNPHHWQYWILINDDPKEGTILLDMPDNYILEMICDWWAFSWKSGNLDEIFKWYEEHGPYMKLSIRTRQKVEDAFSLIKQKLEDMKDILNLQISQMCQKKYSEAVDDLTDTTKQLCVDIIRTEKEVK